MTSKPTSSLSNHSTSKIVSSKQMDIERGRLKNLLLAGFQSGPAIVVNANYFKDLRNQVMALNRKTKE
jgi:hypothetical protein